MDGCDMESSPGLHEGEPWLQILLCGAFRGRGGAFKTMARSTLLSDRFKRGPLVPGLAPPAQREIIIRLLTRPTAHSCGTF
jgi:hypothetical protein